MEINLKNYGILACKTAAIRVTSKESGIKHCDHWKEKKNKSDISYMPGVFWDKVIDFTDESVVQCDLPAVKKYFMNNDDRK